MKDEYVICAAIHFDDYKKYEHQPLNIETGFVICGRMHHNCFMTKKILSEKRRPYCETQGFLTSKNKFQDRFEAYELAVKNGQIQDVSVKKELFSEMLY